jgi:leucyl-tRNA synthetase
MKEYNHKDIEKKWQQKWAEDKIFETQDKVEGKENEYILVEFPYPSGNLHVGHWYAYSVTDIYARYRRMLGKNVLFPVGFDAFGLPAENAAIKNKVNPRDWTYSNIEFMEKQLLSMGAMFDWSRKVITADTEYYKWTQWLFLQFLKNDLAYQAENYVNWCPSCKTILANEQVKAGKCERCESDIEQKVMKEWKLKITNYAQKLLDGLDVVDWPSHIKDAQRNWIGKSEGTYFSFNLKDSDKQIKVFTTRADTYYGITYLVLAPENKLVDELKEKISNFDEVEKYRKVSGTKTELQRVAEVKEKTGVRLNGVMAIHPANGKMIPIFISDYVIASYGTGAVMAVPAHDDRDHEFAKKFGIEIIEVVKPSVTQISERKQAFVDEGILANSGEFDGLSSKDAIIKITEKFGEKTTNYRIRDWSVSRQRYWGCPIPVIHCDKCGAVPVEEKDLPVVLPELEDFTPRDDGKSPLAKAENWVQTKCPKCGIDAHRETDTLDTFIDSSWYFLRYIDPKNLTEFSSKEKQKEWMPVDFYSGGSEHTTMHLLYARFFQKVLFDLKLVNDDEPFIKRNNRGLILGPDGDKMSKSKGNVIDPDELVEKLGSDTVRSYLAFIGPYNEAGSYPWDPNGVVGVRRFIERVVALSDKISDSDSEEVTKLLHKTIKGVGEDYQNLKFNTAISKMMIFSNLLEKEKFSRETYKTLIQIFSPITPHVCEELWYFLGETNPISQSVWPTFDETKMQSAEIDISVQINGKIRFRTSIDSSLSDDEVKTKILGLVQTKRWLDNKRPSRVVYIKGRIINLVLPE